MFNIFETTCVLLIIIAHCPLNIFGGTMHEESAICQHSEIIEKLKNEIELKQKGMQKDIELKQKDIELMRKYIEEKSYILKAIIELQKAKPNNCLNDGRNENENVSIQDNIVSIPSDLRNNDVHFNCIKNCSPTSRSCDEALSANNFIDGVYLLKEPKSDLKPFYVYCIHEDKSEQGWMVIQRRQDGSVSFNRNWLDYKLGFGDLDGEYWIGLERLHQITSSKPHELWVVVYNFENKRFYSKYSKFNVGSENEGYRLTLGGHSGDMRNKLNKFNYMKFTTRDKDNDNSDDENCAHRYGGGGWWHGYLCPSYSYFTKLYEKGLLHDYTETGHLQKVFMAIRPK